MLRSTLDLHFHAFHTLEAGVLMPDKVRTISANETLHDVVELYRIVNTWGLHVVNDVGQHASSLE